MTLIGLLILCIIVYLLFYVTRYLPAEMVRPAQIVIAIVCIIYLLTLLIPGLGRVAIT